MCVCGQLQSAAAPCHVRAITLIVAITLAASPSSFMAGNHLWWLVEAAEPFTGRACSGLPRNRQATADPADDFTGVVTMSGLGSDRLYKLFRTGISDCLLWRPSRVENTIKREFKRKIKSNAAPIFPSIISFPDAVSGTFVCLGCRN